MKKGLLKIVLVSLGFASTAAFASWQLIKSETGNHCADQVIGHLRYLYGQEVKITSKYSEICHGGDSSCMSWYKTNLCSGYFVGVTVRGASCTHAHYGFVPMYTRRIWANGDCQQIMPHDVYPRNDNTDQYIRRPS